MTSRSQPAKPPAQKAGQQKSKGVDLTHDVGSTRALVLLPAETAAPPKRSWQAKDRTKHLPLPSPLPVRITK